MDLLKWRHQREAGFTTYTADREFVMRNAYKSLDIFHSCEDTDSAADEAALYNLEFSDNGKILATVKKDSSVLIYDVVTQLPCIRIPDAHTRSVNNIKFLDGNLFATCSDDATVAIWDMRNAEKKLRALHGHSNCVKDIEYYKQENLLITSSFDGNIFTWDVKSETEQSLVYQKVFHLSGLMRCAITSDYRKMILTTTGGYILVIHDLNLNTLQNDLNGFKPSIYRLMQMGDQYIPQAAKYDHVFQRSQRRNRVQIIDDFPEKDVAELIKSLQIHPNNQCILTRNRTSDEQSEWTCVHSLHDEAERSAIDDSAEPSAKRKRPEVVTQGVTRLTVDEQLIDSIVDSVTTTYRPPPFLAGFRATSRRSPPSPPPAPNAVPPHSGRLDSFIPDIWAAEVTVQDRCLRQNRSRNSTPVSGYNFVYAINSGVLPPSNSSSAASTRASQNSNGSGSSNSSNSSPQQSSLRPGSATRQVGEGLPIRLHSQSMNIRYNNSSSSSSSGVSSHSAAASTSAISRLAPSFRISATATSATITSLLPERLTASTSNQPTTSTAAVKRRNIIFQNPKKLLYYTKDCSELNGFIREPCFSADGRIICSPYGRGVRLYGFNPQCSEYPFVDPNQPKPAPKELFQLSEMLDNPGIVLSSKFSPVEPILVAGCYSGQLLWYRPYL